MPQTKDSKSRKSSLLSLKCLEYSTETNSAKKKKSLKKNRSSRENVRPSRDQLSELLLPEDSFLHLLSFSMRISNDVVGDSGQLGGVEAVTARAIAGNELVEESDVLLSGIGVFLLFVTTVVVVVVVDVNILFWDA